MATVSAVPMPESLSMTYVNSSDTSDITLVTAVAGKVVRLWGAVLAGGTSITVKSNSTVLAAVTTTGLSLPNPRGRAKQNPDPDLVFPHFQSVAGETIKITPGASGMTGWIYWTIDP